MSLTNITKNYSRTYTELQRQMPLRNVLLEFLILLHYRDYIDIRDEIEWSKCKWTVENAKKWMVLKGIKCLVQ